MYKKALILIQAVLVLCLVGCNDKLTKETAKEVLEKELLAKQPKRSKTITFEEGSAGFEYFQKMIAGGKFEFKSKEKLWVPLSKEPMFEKTYAPVSELADVYEEIIIRDELDVVKATALDLMDATIRGKSKLQRKVYCIADCWITHDVVQSVDSVLTDEKTGMAKVKFTIAEVPIEPCYEELSALAKSDPKNPVRGFQLRKPYSGKVKMKKYDEGWAIE